MEGLLQIRQSLGGASYSAWSGIPSLIGEFSAAVTYEGDNTVMAQQSFGYLQKLYKKARTNKKVEGLYEYLHDIDHLLAAKCRASCAEDFCSIEQVDEALQACTAATVQTTMDTIFMSKARMKEVRNHRHALEVVEAALCHLKYVTFVVFRRSLQLLTDEKLRGHFTNMCSLVGLVFLQECLAAGYDSGYFKTGDRRLVQGAITLLLKRLRPQAIPLAELMDLPDHTLTSAIGNSYGDIYETQFEWAKNSKLNDGKDNIPAHFHTYLGPILQGKL